LLERGKIDDFVRVRIKKKNIVGVKHLAYLNPNGTWEHQQAIDANKQHQQNEQRDQQTLPIRPLNRHHRFAQAPFHQHVRSIQKLSHARAAEGKYLRNLPKYFKAQGPFLPDRELLNSSTPSGKEGLDKRGFP
jgi:hypothetical protein